MSWVKPCGTEAGAKRHRRAGEDLCEPCREAAALARRHRDARRAEVNPRSINELRGRLRVQMEKRGWTLYLFSQNTLVPYATVQRFMGPEDAPLMQWRTFDKIREAVENLEAGVVPADEEDRRAQVAQRDAYNLRALERFMEGRRRRIAAARRRAGLGELVGVPL